MIAILSHMLWATVYVYQERNDLASEAGAAGFLYPFLGGDSAPAADPTAEVAESIRMKVRDDAALRERVATEESERIQAACRAIAARIRLGGKLLLFGNGGSATD